jgi:CheY-like chemotaxis protein
MDGFTIFQRLQENPVTHSIPVVLLTAKVQSADRAKFTQLGVAGVIIKPFDPVQLAAQVASAVGWNF